jgi:hypothetical protein
LKEKFVNIGHAARILSRSRTGIMLRSRKVNCCREFRISEICEAVPRRGDVSSGTSDAPSGGVTYVNVVSKSMYTETKEGRASSAYMRPARQSNQIFHCRVKRFCRISDE